jgi:hypothetical protein
LCCKWVLVWRPPSVGFNDCGLFQFQRIHGVVAGQARGRAFDGATVWPFGDGALHACRENQYCDNSPRRISLRTTPFTVCLRKHKLLPGRALRSGTFAKRAKKRQKARAITCALVGRCIDRCATISFCWHRELLATLRSFGSVPLQLS